MYNNKGIENAGPCMNPLNEELKNDLRNHHFRYGNEVPNKDSEYRKEYYDKSNMNPNKMADFYKLGRKLRSSNFTLGDYIPDYLTEFSDKYHSPENNPNDIPQQKISTEALQKSHYVFGKEPTNWNTTNRATYTPKKQDNKRYTKNLTKTNFILGDEEPTMKSEYMQTYKKHPTSAKPQIVNKELANDLRKHHFNFGNEHPQQLTINDIAYQDPNLNPNIQQLKQTLDNNKLRQTHWTLGEENIDPDQHYQTTYAHDMQPKQRIPNPAKSHNTFGSNFKITGNLPTNYQSDYRANFKPNQNNIDPNDVNVIHNVIKNNKNSHFDFGNMDNDYGTTMNNSYKYDPNLALNAKNPLDKDLINNLRAHHYKFGEDKNDDITTQRHDFVPYDSAQMQQAFNPQLQKSNFVLGDANNNKLKGKTIYMTDYVEKPIPYDESNDCWC